MYHRFCRETGLRTDLKMAAFFRRIRPQSCRGHYRNICLMERHETNRFAKLSKVFGLVSYSQMQQKHSTPAATSPSNQPKLQASSIAKNLTADCSSVNAYPHSVRLDLALPIFKDRFPVRTYICDVENNESLSNKSTMLSTYGGRKFSTKLRIRFKKNDVHGSINHFPSQRTYTSFVKTNSPLRYYTTGPRPRRKTEKSYYDVLNTTPNATQAQVKEAYFKLSKIYHPDKNKGSKDAQRKFASINEAYSVLGNVTLRKRYDRGTLNQRDVHGEVRPEDKAAEEAINRDPMYTSSGVPFSVEAKRHAKNMDDFFVKHYKDARDKEQRDRAERKQRVDEYMELQRKAKLSPLVLMVFMISAVALGIKSVTENNVVKGSGSTKESR